MGIDSDDRLLHSGIGINDEHEKIVRERLLSKSILPSFNYDDTEGSKYHYTSPQGLLGIMRTRTFFFTDSQFLNDYREKVSINDELDYFWNHESRRYEKRFRDLLKNIRVTQHEDDGFSYIDKELSGICRYFVFSTSMDGDCLSMWKYYTKAANYDGYCLELFDMALDDEWIDRTTGAAVIAGQVKYNWEEKQETIRAVVNRLYTIWKSYQYSDLLDKKVKREFASWISVEALFFKDECFKDERETRYIAVVPKDRLNDMYYEYNGVRHKMYDFRIVNGMFIPYIKMPFNGWNQEECWAIRSIRIGPSDNADQKEAGLSQFMKSLDYELEECRIKKSRIPVRY